METFRSWRSYRDFARHVKQRSRYIRDKETEDFLQVVRETCKARILRLQKDSSLWRAQTGCELCPKTDGSTEYDEEVPYGPERMTPTADRAQGGRVNSEGIPCLYLATDKNTAMAEVRPWLDSHVSLGHFQILRDLRLIDCSEEHESSPVYFSSEAVDVKKAVWTDIDHSFSKPVDRSNMSVDYVPTQILSELFREIGFDGVGYKSRLTKNGFTVALFDIEAAKLTSCTPYTVEDISYRFEQSGNTRFFK